MQRIQSFLGWGFAAFFGMLFLGSLLSGAPIGALVSLLWILICLPPINRVVLAQGVRRWVWWKVAIFVIGFFLIGITAEPKTPTATIDAPPVVSSPVSESATPEPPAIADRPIAESSPSPIASPAPAPEPEPEPKLEPAPEPELEPAPAPAPAPEPVAIPSPSPSPVATGPIREPVSGSCDCPYDTDSAGRRCGGRSAYSRPGEANLFVFEDQ